jgi:pimeloyl-ACP methyl ester carboxylesterase
MSVIKRHKKLFITTTAVLLFLLALLIAGAIYVNIYYHADTAAIAQMPFGREVAVDTDDNGNLIFSPIGAPRAGLIFYPGGKVEHTAYEPLMRALAERGILCVLVKMPFRLAVLDSAAAKGIPARFSEVGTWYLAGHSLGGSMAAYYLEEPAERYAGLVLLGAYSTSDLSGSELSVLSIYGSEDGVLDREAYAEYLPNLPAELAEYVIEGGNHAFFGTYGQQEGDGTAAITNEEQIALTADVIAAFIGG